MQKDVDELRSSKEGPRDEEPSDLVSSNESQLMEMGPETTGSGTIYGEAGEEKVEDALVERLKGWRLHGTTISCMLCVFLANLEIAIVSTALVSITDALQSFNLSSWIITSYLLTYTGCLIIWSKLSDTLGRRQCLCAALVIFTVASGACGAAQTTDQLIAFRAIQGIGGSGLLSLTFVIVPEMVKPEQYALYASFTSFAFILGFLFGPLLGGAIVDNTTWRWVFLINLPIGVVTLVAILLFIPPGFPDIKSTRPRIRLSKLKEIDFLGALLIFGTSAFIVSALEEADTTYAWSSPAIIVLLVLSSLFALGFIAWEYVLESGLGKLQPLFTWRFMTNRIFMGALLITFLAGVPFTVSVIQIPQEWQTVSNTSALEAGIRLLPFTLCYSAGTVLSMILASKLHIPPVFIALAGATLQVVSTATMALIPLRAGAGKYATQVILSIGLGLNLGIMVQLTPQLIRGKDQAAAMGAIIQFRALGGVVGFAITTNAFNSYIKSNLAGLLSPVQSAGLLQSITATINHLPPALQDAVRSVLASAYDLEIKILIAFAIAQALAVSLMWERDYRRLI